jgi:hypothetical protein
MKLETGEGQVVRADEDGFGSRWWHPESEGGDAAQAESCLADALDEAVMSKLDRLAAELRALGIEF